jgi:hypothetical protein
METCNCGDRISKTEWILEQHTADLREQSDITKHLKKSLFGIERTLIQLKWFAIGVCALFVLDQLGMSEIINLMRI